MRTMPLFENETIHYPLEWEDEFKRSGFPSIWLAEFPELFVPNNGVHKPFRLPRNDVYGFADYALMYLLRRSRAVWSTTYFEIGANPKRSSPEAKMRRNSVQAKVRQWMGDENFVPLQLALLNAGYKTYKGEPDLFCWSPDTGEWFFAEAKGRRDRVKEHQPRWFAVCREDLPDVKIVVCNLRPEPDAARQGRKQ
jgi:hypothetical protein